MATTRALEDAEIFVIFAAIGERHATRNRTMLWVGIHMGLRASELCGLTISDVWDGKSVRTYVTIRAEIAKGNRDRTIRIGDEVKAVIDEFIAWKRKHGEPVKESAPLFVSQKGGHVSRITLFNIVKRLMVLAGIDQSPHCLRKTGATLYYRKLCATKGRIVTTLSFWEPRFWAEEADELAIFQPTESQLLVRQKCN